MLPLLAAGFIFGAGAVLGQKYAEKILIPVATAFMEEFREKWDAHCKKCDEKTED